MARQIRAAALDRKGMNMADHSAKWKVATSYNLKSGDRGKVDDFRLLANGQSGEASFKIGQPLRLRMGNADFFLSFVGTLSTNDASYPVAKLMAMPHMHYVFGLDPDSADAPSKLVLSGDGKNVDDTEDFAIIN